MGRGRHERLSAGCAARRTVTSSHGHREIDRGHRPTSRVANANNKRGTVMCLTPMSGAPPGGRAFAVDISVRPWYRASDAALVARQVPDGR